MTRFLFVVLFSVLIAGCIEEKEATLKEGEVNIGFSPRDIYKKVCFEGVSYWYGPYRLAPVYNTDGEIVLCDSLKTTSN